MSLPVPFFFVFRTTYKGLSIYRTNFGRGH